MTTVAEVIYKLEYQRRDFNDRMIDYGGVNEAYDMAIRSLEAWEKVRTEIEKIGGSEEKSVYKCQHPSYIKGLEKSLEIIDKHLKEVTECK